MAELREAVSKPQREGNKPGPVSMKNVRHLQVLPAFGGKVAIEHHYEQNGGSYREPATKKMEPEQAVAHIAKFLGVQHAEPGGESEHEEAGEHEEPEEPEAA